MLQALPIMAANPAPYPVSQRPYTSPHKTVSSPEFTNPSRYTAPVLSPPYSPQRTNSSLPPANSAPTVHEDYVNYHNTNEQPHSFPTTGQHHSNPSSSKAYSSLDLSPHRTSESPHHVSVNTRASSSTGHSFDSNQRSPYHSRSFDSHSSSSGSGHRSGSSQQSLSGGRSKEPPQKRPFESSQIPSSEASKGPSTISSSRYQDPGSTSVLYASTSHTRTSVPPGSVTHASYSPTSSPKSSSSGSRTSVPRASDSHSSHSHTLFQSSPSNPSKRRNLESHSTGPNVLPSPIPQPPSDKHYSGATLENARYSLGGPPTSDHPNEDRHFALEGPKYKVFGVFDGHDGPRAAGFASNYMMELFDTPSWKSIVTQPDHAIITEALGEFFLATDRDFFRSIRVYINEKEALQRVIPQHLTSYAAYQQYPYEVARLQEVETKLTGGCTAVLAVIANNRLYVANTGDSRAVLIREQVNGTLVAEQLTVDHTVENEDELKRLEKLNLDPKKLIKAGRLGMQENTRSIGDYSIKDGYKDVDTLRSAKSPPGIAKPFVMGSRKIDDSFKYLVLMTDGVYKSIESTLYEQQSIDPNKLLVRMLERSIDLVRGNFGGVTDNLLERLSKIHKDCYQKNAAKDQRSPLAVACRKRDDMTLLVHKFSN